MAADKCVYIEPSDEVLRVMAARMRPEDAREAIALGHATPFDALASSRDASSVCMAAAGLDAAGDLWAVGGLVTHEEFNGVAVPWAILSDAGARRKRWIVREARRWIRQWAREWELRNGVHALNQRGIDFVRVLGFEICEEPFQHEATGAEFLIFSMPREKVVEVPLCASS